MQFRNLKKSKGEKLQLVFKRKPKKPIKFWIDGNDKDLFIKTLRGE
jgi:hypothetical protein